MDKILEAIDYIETTDHPPGCLCRLCVDVRIAIRSLKRCRHKKTVKSCLSCTTMSLIVSGKI